jgi:hypothetical protein
MFNCGDCQILQYGPLTLGANDPLTFIHPVLGERHERLAGQMPDRLAAVGAAHNNEADKRCFRPDRSNRRPRGSSRQLPGSRFRSPSIHNAVAADARVQQAPPPGHRCAQVEAVRGQSCPRYVADSHKPSTYGRPPPPAASSRRVLCYLERPSQLILARPCILRSDKVPDPAAQRRRKSPINVRLRYLSHCVQHRESTEPMPTATRSHMRDYPIEFRPDDLRLTSVSTPKLQCSLGASNSLIERGRQNAI